MSIVDKLYTEWAWRTKTGIPDINNPEDKVILNKLIKELYNFDEKKPEITEVESSTSLDQLIKSKYAVQGQDVLNVDNFYNSIIKSPNSKKLLNLITNSGNKKLSTSHNPIDGLEKELFDLIMQTIKIPNGEPSELWFAIIYDGQIKGGVAGETGITSDVDVDGQGVSLKNYGKINSIDFGSLGKTVEELLRDSINLFQILTGGRVTKSLTRPSINKMLDLISSPEVINDIEEILKLSEQTNIQAIKRLAMQIEDNLEERDPRSIVNKFCNGIDANIKSKLNEVKWWATIHNGVCYLESSTELYDKLRCQDNRLSPYISQFKDLHLFVNGNALFKEVTT
tara:strand:+ start:47 stop:1063 length:1017 start_codon:yes stop_codon:yes gene_type:complete